MGQHTYVYTIQTLTIMQGFRFLLRMATRLKQVEFVYHSSKSPMVSSWTIVEGSLMVLQLLNLCWSHTIPHILTLCDILSTNALNLLTTSTMLSLNVFP